jgi:alpha-N-arabinofuranosidase
MSNHVEAGEAGRRGPAGGRRQARRVVRRAVLAVLAAVAVTAVTALASPPPIARAAGPITITVSHTRYVTADGVPVGPVPPGVVGGNQRWPDDGKGIWNSAADRPADGIVPLSEQAGLHTLRYPGGTVANTFDFKAAIGPLDQRKCQTSGGYANGRFAPTDSRFGPDENGRLADAIGGDTMVMLSAVNSAAGDAADYVEYLNSPADGTASNPRGGVDWAEVRAGNGHPAPYGVHYWEFGNEPFLDGQHYWWSNNQTTRLKQFIEGGWQHQTAQDAVYDDNDGLFTGCDLLHRQKGSGEPNQQYRVRFGPIALPGDEQGVAGVGDGPVTAPVLKVAGTTWQRVISLAAQGPTARVYAINKANGTVRFGDGTHGAVPPAGASLSIEYTSGVHQGYLAFRDAMKSVDPSISVCSGWGRPEFADEMGTRPYDCLGVHSYTTPAADGTLTRYGNLQAGTPDRDQELRNLRLRVATYFPDTATRPELLVTEYGTLNVPDQYEGRLAHVVYLAALVAGQLENNTRVSINSNTADLPLADGTPNGQELFGSGPNFVRTGRAEMLQLYSTMVGGHVVRTTLANNPTLTAPDGTYKALRVVTSCRGQTTRMIVVNRDANQALPVDVALPDQPIQGSVTVSTLNGPSVAAVNKPGEPLAITVSTSSEQPGNGVLRHTFEPHSVTLLVFPGTGQACGS